MFKYRSYRKSAKSYQTYPRHQFLPKNQDIEPSCETYSYSDDFSDSPLLDYMEQALDQNSPHTLSKEAICSLYEELPAPSSALVNAAALGVYSAKSAVPLAFQKPRLPVGNGLFVDRLDYSSSRLRSKAPLEMSESYMPDMKRDNKSYLHTPGLNSRECEEVKTEVDRCKELTVDIYTDLYRNRNDLLGEKTKAIDHKTIEAELIGNARYETANDEYSDSEIDDMFYNMVEEEFDDMEEFTDIVDKFVQVNESELEDDNFFCSPSLGVKAFEREWYYKGKDTNYIGPFSSVEMLYMYKRKMISLATLVKCPKEIITVKKLLEESRDHSKTDSDLFNSFVEQAYQEGWCDAEDKRNASPNAENKQGFNISDP